MKQRLSSALLVAVLRVPAAAQESQAVPSAAPADPSTKFDIAFYFWMSDLEGDLTVRDLTVEAGADFNFDPMIGTRVGWDVAEWLQLTFRFDVAGFGVGTELTGNAVITAGVRVSPTATVIGGWRSMAIEIDEDRYDLDVRLKGPLLAVNVKF